MNQENKSSPNVIQIVLVACLIVAAFFIGMLWTKVKTLESTGGPSFANNGANTGNGANAGNNNAPTNAGSADNVDPVSKDDWVTGNKNARYALIEYSDIDCPFCKQFHPTAQQLIKDRNDFMWVYRNFPLDSLHPNARRKAEAAECAGKVGGNDKFWAFLNEAVSEGSAVGPDKMSDIASKVGVNVTNFNNCYNKNETKDLVNADITSGTKAGINGTPGNILLDTKTGKTVVVPGAVPYEQLKSYVAQLVGSAK